MFKLWACFQKKHNLLLLGDTSGHLLFLGWCHSSHHYKACLKEGPGGPGWGWGHRQVALRKEVSQEQDTWNVCATANHSLQGTQRFSWACVLHDIYPGYSYEQALTLLRMSNMAAWPYRAGESFCAAKPGWTSLTQATESRFLQKASVRWPCEGL